MGVILSVENLSFSIKKGDRKIYILENINFSIRKGEVFCILGPNGAGKSTLLKFISLSLPVSEGRIYFYEKESISFIPEELCLPNFLRVRDVLKLVKIVYKDVNLDVIKHFSLENLMSKKIFQLSQGQKRTLQIALSLFKDSSLFIWDEPTVFLDISFKEKMKKIINSLKLQNKTVIISSHILSEIEKISDRALFLDKGKIVKILNKEEFKDFGNLEEAFKLFYEVE